MLSLLLTAAMLVTAQVFPASAENAADPAEASAGAAAPSNPVHHCTKENDGSTLFVAADQGLDCKNSMRNIQILLRGRTVRSGIG